MLVADVGGSVVQLNLAGLRLLGVERDRVIGQPLAMVLPLTDGAGQDWWTVADPYRGLAIRTGQPERELHLHRADGSQIVLAVTARYVRDRPLGPVVRVIVVFRSMRQRARSRTERAAVLGTVAHELRNPLTGVKGFTATLLKNWDRFTDDQRKLMLGAVESDADRIARLVTDMLDTSRIDAGRIEVKSSVVDVPGMLDRVVASRTAPATTGADAGVQDIAITVASDLPDWWADSDRIRQVLDNLLDNALLHGRLPIRMAVSSESTQAGPVGSGVDVVGTGRPSVPSAGPTGQVVITVDDSGDGFPPGSTGKVFSKFWRADQGTRGTGLGLYVCRGLVEAHGGQIFAESAPGGGARVRVVVPAGDPPAHLV